MSTKFHSLVLLLTSTLLVMTTFSLSLDEKETEKANRRLIGVGIASEPIKPPTRRLTAVECEQELPPPPYFRKMFINSPLPPFDEAEAPDADAQLPSCAGDGACDSSLA